MTADERYAANCALLAANPTTAGMLPQLQQYPLTNLQLMPSPTGSLYGQAWDVTKQVWVPLTDPNDPEGQARADAEKLYTPHTKVFCLLGVGLGYFVVELAKLLKPYQRLCVWDLDPGMYKAMLYCCDVAPLHSEKRIDVIVGNDIVQQVEPWWMRLEAQDKLHILPPMRAGYTSVYMSELYDALLEKTIEMLRYHMVGMATWRMFGQCIGDNDLRNAPEYFSTPGYEHLCDLWKNQPAICIAAGPSLQKNLSQLFPQAMREKVAIITAGTVYALLHGLGLEPDVVTTIDFQRRNWTEQFRHVPLDPDCPLVYLHSTYPQTVRRWPGPRFVAENASDTTGWLRKYSDGKKSAAQVQTVAHLNVMVALEMGANPIILLGQDLSMPISEHHTAGARAEDSAPSEAPAEAFMLAKDWQGQDVHTRHSFMSMKTVFERLFAEHPDRTFLNCSEAGLPLHGAVNMPLTVALRQCQLLPGEGRHSTLRPRIKKIWRGYKPKINEGLLGDLDILSGHVEEIAVFCDKVQDLWAAAQTAPKCLTEAQRTIVLSEECEHWAEAGEEVYTERYLRPILEQECVVQGKPTAFSLFAIRHFGIIELSADIPPRLEEIDTEAKKARFNAERLARLGVMIAQEVPQVRRVLRETKHRLQGLSEFGDPEKALAAQRYDTAAALLDVGAPTWCSAQRLQGQLFEQTQQYEAALACYERWGEAPGHLPRIRQYLGQWRADVREAMGKYFQATGETTPPAVAAAPDYPWHG